MERAAVERFLADRGVGVLSMADDGEAYGIPLSYGYDAAADRLYFVLLQTGERSQKEAFVERTDRASFTVFDVAGRGDWRSVVARGPLRPLDEDEYERATAAIESDAWYPSLFRESTPTRGIAGWTLEVEELTGLRGEDA